MLIVKSILFIIVTTYLNHMRGGGPFKLKSFIKDKTGINLGRSLYIVTFFYFLIFNYWFDYDLIPSILLALGFFVWGVSGWGSYFDGGYFKEGYKDETEVLWVDWILLKIFGPKWIPASDKKTKEKFDLIKSPDGGYRPFKWRRKRDVTGMYLRQFHALPFFGVMSYYQDNWWISLHIIPFVLGVGLIYQLVHTKFVREFFLKNNFELFANNKYCYFVFEKIPVAELTTGAIWGILILLCN